MLSLLVPPISLEEDEKLARQSKPKFDVYPEVHLQLTSEKVATENSGNFENMSTAKRKEEAEKPLYLRRL